MVESAMVSTITIPVPAERPPRKARSASSWRWWAMGTVSTKVSASTPAGKSMSPPSATGSTKRLMSRR
jgi:hypothetical protein